MTADSLLFAFTVLSLVFGVLTLGHTIPKPLDDSDDMTVHSTTGSFISTRQSNGKERDLVVGGIRCRSGASTRCICTLETLLSAFESASTNARRLTKISLCHGSAIAMDKPINITGKAFALKCIRPNQCSIEGVNSNLFVGAPLIARFVFVSLLSGEAEKGGALHLTGGKTHLRNVEMNGNTASVTGGAVYLEGPDTELSYRRAVFIDNFSSGTGGAISVANGATLRTFAAQYRSNIAATFGGAVYNNGGYVKLDDSIFDVNFATSGIGNTVYTTTDNQTTTLSETECGAIIRVSFCEEKDSIVTDGTATSNCRENGLFRLDPRCKL